MQEQTFQESMADWLRHAPYLTLSLVLHVIAIAIFLLMPPTLIAQEKKALTMAPVEEEVIIEEPEEPKEEPKEEEPEEPILQEAEISELRGDRD